MLYKLDTLKRKDAEGPTTGASTPNGSKKKAPEPEPEIRKPTYTQK